MKSYRNIYLEGGEGYNPYARREEEKGVSDRDALLFAARSLRQKISRWEYRQAMGDPEAPGIVENLKEDLAEVERRLREIEAAEAQNDPFWAEWTRETFEARRRVWNDRVRRMGPRVSTRQIAQLERELGYSFRDLERAKARYEGGSK